VLTGDTTSGAASSCISLDNHLSVLVLLKRNQIHRSDRIVSIDHCLVPCAIKPVKLDLACKPDGQITTTDDVLKTHRLVTRGTRPHFSKFVHSVNVAQDNFRHKHYPAVGGIASRSAKRAHQYMPYGSLTLATHTCSMQMTYKCPVRI